MLVLVFAACKSKKEVIAFNQGEYSNPLPVFDHSSAFVENQCVGIDQANWEYVGPEPYLDNRAQWHGYTWKILGDSRNYPQDMTKDILIGTAGSGLWRYEEISPGIKEWQCKTEELNLQGQRINDIVRNPCDPNHILAATGFSDISSTTFGSGIISSKDNGKTWKREPLGNSKLSLDHSVLKIFFDKYANCVNREGNYFVLSKKIKSFQLGRMVNGKYVACQLPELKNHFDFYDIEQAADGVLLLSDMSKFGRGASIYKSTDSGQSWKEINTDLPDFPLNDSPKSGCSRCSSNRDCFCRPVRINISVEKNGSIFLYCSNQMFYQSNDHGKSWERLPINKLNRVDNNKLDIEQSPFTGLVYFGGVQPWVWNGEKRFSYNQGHDDVRDYYFLGYDEELKEEKVLLANDGGVSLVTWNTEKNKGKWEDVCGSTFAISQLNGIGIAQSNEENYVLGIMHCNSFHFDGNEWKKIGGGDGGGCLIDPMNKENYFASGNPALMKYGGDRPVKAYRNNAWMLRKPVKNHPANANLIYMGRGQDSGQDCGKKSFAGIAIYNDLTGKVEQKKINDCNMFQPSAIGLSLTNPDLIIVCSGKKTGKKTGRLMKSMDNGDNWEDLSTSQVQLNNGEYKPIGEILAWRNAWDILVDPLDEKVIYLTLSNHTEKGGNRIAAELRVLKSQNGGRSWQDYSQGLPAVAATCLLAEHNSPGRIYLGTEMGVYYREDGHDSWICFNSNLPLVEITELEINYCRNELYAGTYGRGLWRTSLSLPEWRMPMEVKKSEKWSSDRVVYSDILLKKNVHLEIDAKVLFKPGTRIYLESGARISGQENTACLCDENEKCAEIIQLN